MPSTRGRARSRRGAGQHEVLGKRGVVQIGAGEIGTGERGVGEVGAAEVGGPEISVGQDSAPQAGAGKQGPPQIRTAQLGEAQVGIGQVGEVQVGAGEVRMTEVRPRSPAPYICAPASVAWEEVGAVPALRPAGPDPRRSALRPTVVYPARLDSVNQQSANPHG